MLFTKVKQQGVLAMYRDITVMWYGCIWNKTGHNTAQPTGYGAYILKQHVDWMEVCQLGQALYSIMSWAAQVTHKLSKQGN